MKRDLIFISIESWTEFGSYRDINNFKDWVEYNIEIIESDNNSQLKQEDFILDNSPAIKLSFVNWPYENWIGRRIFTQKGKRIFEINASIDPEYQTTYLPIFDKMLSSIKLIEEFCGTSTNGSCVSDSDCVKGGCSGQVCQSKNEEPTVTTCEYKDCYNAQSYGLNCKCVDKKCQWAK
jgi:eight-cysteine-cluster-containing protein